MRRHNKIIEADCPVPQNYDHPRIAEQTALKSFSTFSACSILVQPNNMKLPDEKRLTVASSTWTIIPGNDSGSYMTS